MNRTPSQARRFALCGRAFIPLLIVGLGVVLTGCPALLNQPPIANMTGSPLQGEAPLTVDFDASGSSDGDGTIASFSWDFGDGDTGSGQTPSHTFESEGTYNVVLTVTDNQGGQATDSLVVTVGEASIFFSSTRSDPDGDIFRMETDGANQAQVTSDPNSDIFPALLPSTREKLAFASNRDNAPQHDLFTSQPDGTLPVNHTGAQTASEELQPSWDPSGDRLAFASDLDHVGSFYGVYTFDFGSGLISTVSVQSGSQALSPSWSPDGDWIAYASNRDGDYEVFKVKPDGSGEEKLTDNADDDGFDGSLWLGGLPEARGISWSPDGTQLAFVSDRNANLDIFVINADGTGPKQVTTHTADDYDPFWLPNGEEIAFVSTRDGAPEIYKLNVDTLAVTGPLTTLGNNVNPAGVDD